MNTDNKRRCAMLGAALLVLTVTAFGQTTWTNMAGGDWTTGVNWDNDVPDGNFAYLTNATASYTVTFNGPAPVVSNLSISNSVGYLTTLEITNGLLLSSNSVPGIRYLTTPSISLGNNTRLNINTNGQLYNWSSALGIGSNAVVQINGGSLTNRGMLLMLKGSTLIVNSGDLALYYIPRVGYVTYSGGFSTQEAVMVVNGGKVYARASGASGFNIGYVGVGRLVINNGEMYHRSSGINDYLNVGFGQSAYNAPGTARGFIDVYGGVFTNEVPLYLGRHAKANTSCGEGYVLVAGGRLVQSKDIILKA